MEDRFTTLDVHLAAYLELRGIQPRLIRQGRRVIFSFVGSEAYPLVNTFNDNENVHVSDYVSTLKALRGKMYSLKDAD